MLLCLLKLKISFANSQTVPKKPCKQQQNLPTSFYFLSRLTVETIKNLSRKKIKFIRLNIRTLKIDEKWNLIVWEHIFIDEVMSLAFMNLDNFSCQMS